MEVVTHLSRGAIPCLYSEQRHSNGRYQPVLQVFAIEEMPQRAGQPRRFTICLSDGEQWTTSMLTPRAEVCMQGLMPVALHSVVRLVEWHTEDCKDQTSVFVAQLQHLMFMDGPIGDPVRFDCQPQSHGVADTFGVGAGIAMGHGAPSRVELGRFLSTQPGGPSPASGGPAFFAINPYSVNPYMQRSALQLSNMEQGTMSFQAAVHAQQQPQWQGRCSRSRSRSRSSTGQVGHGGVGPLAHEAANESHQQVGYGEIPRPAATEPWYRRVCARAALPSHAGVSCAAQLAGQPSSSGQPQQQAAIPIMVAALTPGIERWTLIARISRKNSVRKFNHKTKKGEGQLFSISLLDQGGDETRATFFGVAVDKFYEILQEGQTYNFSGGRVKQADKRWCHCEHEIIFDEHAVITPVEGDVVRPKMVFDFKVLSSMENIPVGTMVDVAAVIIEIEPPGEVSLKVGGTKRRMNMTLIDDSGTTCLLTLWGEQIDKAWTAGEVVLLKSLKIGDFGGRSLSASFGTIFVIGEDAMSEGYPRAQELASWFAAEGIGTRDWTMACGGKEVASPCRALPR